MPRLRPWPARWVIGKRPIVYQYDLRAGSTFKRGAWVKKDGSSEVYGITASGNTIWASGVWASGVWASGLWASGTSDTTPLLGVASEDAEAVLEAGKVLVYICDTDEVTFGCQGDRAPVVGDIGQDYGIAKDSDGVWYVNTADTTDTRLSVVDVDTVHELYFVRVMSAHRQSA